MSNDDVFCRYLVERAVERLRRQGEAQFAGVSADLEARSVRFGRIKIFFSPHNWVQ